MNSSPGTPAGTGLSRSSSTYTWVLARGPPIVTVSGSTGTRSQVDQMVVSVGPYTFHRSRTRSRSARASTGGSASPPTRAVTDGRSNPASSIACHPDGVACTWVTAYADASLASASGSAASRVPAISTCPPLTRGRKSSSPEMSNDRDVRASQRWPGPEPSSSFIDSSRLTRARCSMATPLGRPVEPEV